MWARQVLAAALVHLMPVVGGAGETDPDWNADLQAARENLEPRFTVELVDGYGFQLSAQPLPMGHYRPTKSPATGAFLFGREVAP
ncbi:MAG: hypothetical protein J5I92_15065 [Thiogranum sp.]|nr:hypothetical protein [Thiogranum sp.]